MVLFALKRKEHFQAVFLILYTRHFFFFFKKKAHNKTKISPDIIKKQSVIVRRTKQCHFEKELKNPQVHTSKTEYSLILETDSIRSKEYLVKSSPAGHIHKQILSLFLLAVSSG